ncbi:hypothetical protein OXIME_001065 [Oxyplasma meridianum]|uniref:Uncharacterized protein n=1 Tax=Oxyplasma meridianum TaxID=3073602 RepID=A0AAX4NGA3_9ARCH
MVEIGSFLPNREKNQALFPEEGWIRAIPFLILAFTMAMLLLGIPISNSSSLYQHIYIYTYG